jgi:hypothetical protein
MDSRMARLQTEIDDAIRGLTPDQLSRQVKGKWSVAEILEHLSMTYTGTAKGLERCLQAGHTLASAPTLYHRFATFVLTGIGYFPEGRTAPKQATPKGSPAEKVVAEVGPQILAMDDLAARCETAFGRNIRILDHPILGPLTINQWRKFHALHGHHHCKQILERRTKLQ